MKKRYIVLLSICLVGLLVCVILGVTRFRGATEENTDLESLRDFIKVFETLPPGVDTEFLPVETLPLATKPSEETEAPISGETAEKDPPPEESDSESSDGPESGPTIETEPPKETNPEKETTPETEKPKPAVPVEASLNFQILYDLNPDIYAWIEIKGTKVDYPVLQNEKNDSKYLTTAYDGSWYVGGALFTQSKYNKKDFNDPVTVIYGHTMWSGTLFGQLQTVYTNQTTFNSHDDIIIYLPGEVRHYTVFAAVPFEKYHILETYDFSKEYWYERFFDKVMRIRSFNACFNKDLVPEFGDRVLILSTCLNEDSSKRFLVMAVCRDDIDN